MSLKKLTLPPQINMNKLNFESKGEARSYYRGFSVNKLTAWDLLDASNERMDAVWNLRDSQPIEEDYELFKANHRLMDENWADWEEVWERFKKL